MVSVKVPTFCDVYMLIPTVCGLYFLLCLHVCISCLCLLSVELFVISVVEICGVCEWVSECVSG